MTKRPYQSGPSQLLQIFQRALARRPAPAFAQPVISPVISRSRSDSSASFSQFSAAAKSFLRKASTASISREKRSTSGTVFSFSAHGSASSKSPLRDQRQQQALLQRLVVGIEGKRAPVVGDGAVDDRCRPRRPGRRERRRRTSRSRPAGRTVWQEPARHAAPVPTTAAKPQKPAAYVFAASNSFLRAPTRQGETHCRYLTAKAWPFWGWRSTAPGSQSVHPDEPAPTSIRRPG